VSERLGIEPVRGKRVWEDDGVETMSRDNLVERLLDQAEQHVDINKVFLDRGFDSMQVRDAIDQRDMLYVLGKMAGADIDEGEIEEIKTDEVYDGRVLHGSLAYGGRERDMSFVYHPADWSDNDYKIWTMNAYVDTGRAQALIGQYDQRMEIEGQYASIKQNFLPKTSSMDYRMWFVYFLIGVVMYNVWRMANFILRGEADANLEENPPITAGEVIELIGLCLFDLGGDAGLSG
jgi:hypothetical protein